MKAVGIRIIVACFVPGALIGQTNPRAVQPERPTVATHAGTVTPGWLEIETGAEFDGYGRGGGSMVTAVPTVFKFGVTSRTQLSLFTPLVIPGGGSPEVADPAIGVKWRLVDDAPLLGRFAVLPSVKLPIASKTAAGTGTTDVGLLLISSHDIGPVALDINVGYTKRSGDGATVPRSSTVWTVSTGGPMTGSVGWVAEASGYPRTSGVSGNPSTVAVLLGPTWTVREWLALDIGTIVPIDGPQPRAIYCGGVWNVGRIR